MLCPAPTPLALPYPRPSYVQIGRPTELYIRNTIPHSDPGQSGWGYAELRLSRFLRSSLAAMSSGILGSEAVYRWIQYRCYSACILMLPGGAQQRLEPPSFRDRNHRDFAP